MLAQAFEFGLDLAWSKNVLGQLTESRGTNEDSLNHAYNGHHAEGSSTFSFEFFPPENAGDGRDSLPNDSRSGIYMPHFISVTYGAGGSTRVLTNDLVERIQHTTKLDPIPHLTCVCHNEEEIEAILLRYARSAIGNILALGAIGRATSLR
jgi:5,10-methylenetetrahydrofolate reductase